MQDKFHSDLEESQKAAKRHRQVVDRIKKRARENPVLLALWVVWRLPDHLDVARAAGFKAWGVDLDDEAQIRKFGPRSVREAQSFMWWAGRQQIYRACLELINVYSAKLSGMALAEAVCEAYIEATERRLFTVALNFEELRKALPEADFPKEELAKVLSGIVSARTPLSGERRDIKDLRNRLAQGGGKPSKQLLAELPAEVLGVFHEMLQTGSTDPAFFSNEARRRIRRVGATESIAEGRLGEINELNEPEDEGSEPEQVLEPAWASELLHDLMDKSDLSRRERESFLMLGRMTSPEAGKKLGCSADQVRQEKFRALKKLQRAAGL